MILNEKIQVVEHNSEWHQQYLDEVNLLKQKTSLPGRQGKYGTIHTRAMKRPADQSEDGNRRTTNGAL